ncbi:MAG: hypothetical protein IT285_12550 [Bdellovibrionales bacterium]|nr:hypothetical protein [Bdellovibrionales bacterium]
MRPEIAEIRNLAEGGREKTAVSRITGLLARRTRLTRSELVELAHCARIAHRPDLSLRVLGRRVRPRGRAGSAPTDLELLQYGMALGELGAIREAIETLARVDAKKHPRALLFRSLAEFRVWNWAPVLEPLRALAALPKLPAPDAMAVQIRLAAAWIHGFSRYEEGLKALEAAESLGAIPGTHRTFLYVDVHLLRVQVYVLSRRLAEARAELQHLQALTSSDAPSLQRYTKLWQRLLEFTESGDAAALRRDLAALKRTHAAAGEWHRERTVDYYLATSLGDTELLRHLWFGTPWPAFRKRVEDALGGAPPLGPYSWRLSGGSKSPWLDVTTGESSWGPLPLKTGQTAQRMLAALAQDFYRHSNAAELLECAYPGEYFHPTASPLKLRQAMARLRAWIRRYQVPLIVREKAGRYHLEATGALTLRVGSPDDAALGDLRVRLEDLRRLTGDAPLAVSQAAKEWKATPRTALRLLKRAVGAGLAERLGRGPATRYRLKPLRSP